MIYFTADFHFGHSNIIKYSNRPFSNVDEMDSVLINNFNSRVSKQDTAYILGDICLAYQKRDYYLDKLNGKKFLIKGTHDNKLDVPLILEIKVDGIYIVLCHYAIRVWARKHYGAYHLYGHSHGTLPFNHDLSYDVGVDNNNFFPVSWEEISNMMQNRINFWGEKHLGIIK